MENGFKLNTENVLRCLFDSVSCHI